MSEATPGPESEAVDSDSLKTMDALLAAEDPSFAAKMSELGQVVVPEGVSLDTSDMEEDLEPFESLDTPPGLLPRLRHRVRWFTLKVQKAALTPVVWFRQLRSGGLPFLLTSLKGWLQLLRTQVLQPLAHSLGEAKASLGRSLDFFKYSTTQVKLTILGGFVLVALSGGVAFLALRKQKLMFWKEEEFSSFAAVADEVWDLPPGEEKVDFYGSSLSPQFFVQIEKMVINLKSAPGSPLPMGAFQFYLEASTQEAAVELKDREKEIRNIIQLAIREVTYDQLSEPEGLGWVKGNIASEINQVLTQGRIRRVLIDTLVLKP